MCLAPYEALRAGILKLGRASIDRDHRTPEVLDLVVEGDCAVCYQHGAAYFDRLLFIELQGPGGGLADV